MSAVELKNLTDEELKAISPDVFVTGLMGLPRDEIESMSRSRSLTEAQSGAIAAFLSVPNLMAPAEPPKAAPAPGKAEPAPAAAKETKKAPPQQAANELHDDYIPLKTRLVSWWHGTNVSPESDPVKVTDIVKEQELDDPDVFWNASRLKAAQSVWGEAFLEPGGAALARKVLSSVGADPSHTILDLSCGLGGTAFTLAKESELWMEAFEPDSELVKRARDFANRYMLTRRVKLQNVDYSEFRLAPSRYDIIYSRERMFQYPQKGRIIKQAAFGLKTRGQFLISDYMPTTEDSEAESIRLWEESEPQKVYPWTKDRYAGEIDKSGMRVRATHDLTDVVLENIHSGWHKMVRSIESDKIDRRFVTHIIREGEVWLGRARAMEAGDLKVLRMHCVKTS